jgi:hypothetical protein
MKQIRCCYYHTIHIMLLTFFIWRADHLSRADQSAVIGINLKKSGWEKRRGNRPSVGAGAVGMRSGDPCGRPRYPCILPGRTHSQRGRPQGSPPRSAPPLQETHPPFVRLMLLRADQSAVSTINRLLRCPDVVVTSHHMVIEIEE